MTLSWYLQEPISFRAYLRAEANLSAIHLLNFLLKSYWREWSVSNVIFFSVFFNLMCIRFVLYYYRAQLRSKQKIITMRCRRIKLGSQWTPSPSPVPSPRDKVEITSLVGWWIERFFTFCSSVLRVGVYLLFGDLRVSQLFPYIMSCFSNKVKYIVVGCQLNGPKIELSWTILLSSKQFSTVVTQA